MEHTFIYDVHVNARVVLGSIIVGRPLLEAHGKKPEEVVAILTHEFGHFKESHLYLNILIDTVYMVIYGLLLTLFINWPSFLPGMGFPQENYFASFILFTYLYTVTLDFPIRLGMLAISRYFEKRADLYATERGYGPAL